eukprot:TRINITY_DN10521_c0_g1_i1.p1 TRINITY_DN10521_c0_g1~~TRINITY_DN10521_c0_g1_i1.p1  ORF type:complete len:359 (+),score=51.28 TRINITY_DN10521_c0_g1_i1:148-1077(+)
MTSRNSGQPYTYDEIKRMTNNFDKNIGQGGFGRVYEGYLEDHTAVAVKVRSDNSRQGPKEFHTEVQLLMKARHRNLVSLIGFCNEETHIALVYEYMSKGNLCQHLQAYNPDARALNWGERLHIALDVAEGLEYLHNQCHPPVVHRDVKPANILIKDGLEAKIADFGLCKAFSNENRSYTSTDPRGTRRYIDPEYEKTGKLTKKSDVYSFGIVLLELIMGESATSEAKNITQRISDRIAEGGIENVVDQKMEGGYNVDSIKIAIETARKSTSSKSEERPTMSKVVTKLQKCQNIQMGRERLRSLKSKCIG